VTPDREPLAESARLRQILWDVHEAPLPGSYQPDVPELALRAVKQLRQDYGDSLDEVDGCSAAVLAEALRAVLSNPMGGYAQAEAYSAARSKGWAALAQYDGKAEGSSSPVPGQQAVTGPDDGSVNAKVVEPLSGDRDAQLDGRADA
jgi:hypothetical protein